MISKDTRIITLDIKSEEPSYKTVEDLFINHADKAYGYAGTDMINLNGIMIQDWTGWTELLKIAKVDNHSNETGCWYRVGISRDVQGDSDLYQITFPYIKVSHAQQILLYDRKYRQRGFHGEVKYKYHIAQPIFDDLTGQLRVREPSFKSNTMWNMYVDELKKFNANIDLSGLINEQSDQWNNFSDIVVEMIPMEDTGYFLITKSGFYNANNIHMYCGNLSSPIVPDHGYK